MRVRSVLLGFGSGVAFGGGLLASGLTHPEVVRGFLDVGGHWNPTVGIVMAIATAVDAVVVRVALRRERPRWASRFALPTRREIDRQLLIGAAIFGIGWGLLGVCPGPALVSVAGGDRSVLTFMSALVAGLVLGATVTSRGRVNQTEGSAS